jgi:hypothetical protein
MLLMLQRRKEYKELWCVWPTKSHSIIHVNFLQDIGSS